MAKVRRLFEARHAEVKRCYEAELQQHADARGKLTLRFTIAESGAIRDVAVARSTFRRPDVPSCVEQVVRRWKTPFHPGEPVEVEYPFSFTPR
jgi:TonB family protein